MWTERQEATALPATQANTGPGCDFRPQDWSVGQSWEHRSGLHARMWTAPWGQRGIRRKMPIKPRFLRWTTKDRITPDS